MISLFVLFPREWSLDDKRRSNIGSRGFMLRGYQSWRAEEMGRRLLIELRAIPAPIRRPALTWVARDGVFPDLRQAYQAVFAARRSPGRPHHVGLRLQTDSHSHLCEWM